MKNHISAEEFMSLDKEVQNVFVDWWKPKEFDILIYKEESFMNILNNNIMIQTIDDDCKIYFKNITKNECIPLLQMHQLIAFIEEKEYKYIQLNNYNEVWNLKVFKSMMQFEPDIEMECENKIELLFKCAVEIAKQITLD